MAFSALDATLPIEVSGEPGIGKTAVSGISRTIRDRFLTAASTSGASPIIRRSAAAHSRHSSKATDLQTTDAEMRVSLQEKRALILLDDVELAPHELNRSSIARRSAFAVATRSLPLG